jgi:Spy/CpxP family protein refolding chaperone
MEQVRQQKFSEIASLLSLTAEQKDRAAEIFDTAWDSAHALLPQFHENRVQLKRLLLSGDAARFSREIATISSQEEQLNSQMAAIRTTAVEQLYGLLTPAQRAKAVGLYDLLAAQFRFRLALTPAERLRSGG